MTHPVTIVIYFDAPGKYDYPFSAGKDYFESYCFFGDYVASQGVQIRYARGDSYLGAMRFASGYQIVNKEVLDVPEPFTADIILNQGGKKLQESDTDLVVNHKEFEVVNDDKLLMYELMPELVAPSYEINLTNWREALQKIKTEQAVLKPRKGAGGKGIIVAPKESIDFPHLNFTQPYLVQDFVDTSDGIPGVTKGLHDLRIMVFNGEPQLSYIRTPAQESFLANLGQGADLTTVPIEKLPESALELVEKVDNYFTKYYPRLYTIDLLYEKGKPWLGEFNTRPGFPLSLFEGKDFMEHFYRYTLDTLLSGVTAK